MSGYAVAGSVCASLLAAKGLAVKVFDSGRGPGGRMSQRRYVFICFFFFGYLNSICLQTISEFIHRSPKNTLFSLDREKVEDGPELMFDHGAQYFTVKSAEVQHLVDKWEASGLVADWEGRFGSLNVATKEFVEETVRTFSFEFPRSLRALLDLLCSQYNLLNFKNKMKSKLAKLLMRQLGYQLGVAKLVEAVVKV